MGFPGFELLLDGFDWREGADFELALEQGFEIGHGREELFLGRFRHAVGEEDAVEMVGLVLDGAGGGIDVDDQSGSVGGFFGARGIWFHGERVGTRAEQGAM